MSRHEPTRLALGREGGRVRGAIALALVVVVGAGLLYSALRGFGATWRAQRAEYERFRPMSQAEREQAFGALIPMPMELFGWYRAQLDPDDAFYVHGAPGGFGQFADLRTTVRNVSRLYFLPAIEVDDPQRATAIVSWGADPAELGILYCAQVRAGLQPYFVSRVSCDR